MQQDPEQLYDIFARRDTHFAPLIFVGVKTTGVFCRPGCPARLPKPENCVFFNTAEQALQSGFRACKRCHPMQLPGEASHLIKKLISLIEDDPERRWSETDLQAMDIDPSTARRHFKSRFGMTFAAYARHRRIAHSAAILSQGEKVIEAQLTAGYDSSSGFRAAFIKTFGQAPQNGTAPPLLIDWIDTPLGAMLAICDAEKLYMLEFTVRKNLQKQMKRLAAQHKRAIIPGRTPITDHITKELQSYFAGTLREFETPLHMTGTEFQKSVWEALRNIPYGTTYSYSQLAKVVGNEKAVRAAASSNANNRLALIIPCHRVIAKGGGLGGYAGGLDKKTWLLKHEQKFA